ncbi:unnamed protein product [Penicillium olsonii]|uniref:Uncharacterized protein n=1 Tax=Penicillium olsonii TaxID=99116 RepID=A0A9W4HDY4_PENOL|nr:unnamed protein product [Penicillium olsonii]CAG7981364.1 unnamed protein product [Penicillium olsonii]
MAGYERNPRSHPYDPAPISEEGPADYVRHSFLSRSEWGLEILTSILALGCLVGVAYILFYIDGKPIAEWRPWISPNAVVSILTTACIAAFMHGVSAFMGQHKWVYFRKKSHRLARLEQFDEASRGPYGSLSFLVKGPRTLATIGALITLAQPLITPCVQQIIQLEQRDISHPAQTAILGYARLYNDTMPKSLTRLDNSAIETQPIDPRMQASIIQGLFGIDITETFSCPGACSWEGSSISLGFKAECSNVTQATLQSATCEGDEDSLQTCNMTTPNGIGLTSEAWFTDRATAFYMNASNPSVGKQTLDTVTQGLPEIMRFGILRSTPDDNFRMREINITDCTLLIAAYNYTGARANGSDITFASKKEIDLGPDNPWHYAGGSVTNDLQSVDPLVFTNKSTNGDVTIPALGIKYLNLMGLRNFFHSPTMVTRWIVGNLGTTNSGVSSALVGEVDIEDRFKKMATAMTNNLRYGPSSKPTYGKVIEKETYVKLNWWYFLVPVVIEAAAIVFAIISMFGSRRSRHVPVWKYSILAVLACQYENGKLYSMSKDIKQIRKEAKRNKAELQ